ncbi:sugar phosphate nucleotidyltransferase [Selenomonas ruminantium]|uniref:sugar phosphate nucleotidyltransferase n=1 Tax=Selenomonas ruminantium TaxID=971 RepID=UPI0026F04483|nr:sugar phosphate nucleotidyltransferase [Selenomonas ruminantium]
MRKSVTREAIVLAGGFGTRLRKVVSDVPKPMAPMDAEGTPFLAFVLKQLAGQGFAKVILSVGYMAEVIQQYFGASYAGMEMNRWGQAER